MSMLSSFGRWLHLKQYQFEVTYTVYMFTPWEKFFMYTIVFLLAGLTFIATVLYLPQHLAFIVGRAWFYMHGENVDVVELTKGAADSALQQIASATTAAAGLAADAAETVAREL
ncbi:hypothetical protein SODALDRAFT_332602 [Sodiomyces alkalinus F11]|uniref:Uncharacterized protein n=1 Tax=Sodiomyces alkalinus (strain CBS 110278 / VKM F-3762 / F11) TaxID=1314773 RepID=A0A3N2PXH9_SODAK|nr:hypothetical protein SODALDRAFT_332602 [Sodiomyces alkalinus F11]ROT39178.1 hypothetical protein SODALDRAFT_332602 [Sodiomyces alkalinus F11]